MIGRGGLEVGIRTRVLNCVISERLMETLSIENTVTPRQGVHKIFHFSYAILRKSLNFLDQFLVLHGRKYSTRIPTLTARVAQQHEDVSVRQLAS